MNDNYEAGRQMIKAMELLERFSGMKTRESVKFAGSLNTGTFTRTANKWDSSLAATASNFNGGMMNIYCDLR